MDLADLGAIIGRPQANRNPLPRFVTEPARGAQSQDDRDQDDED